MKNIENATFAGGCFWCMVKPFDDLPGIVSIVSGFTGGHTENPSYENVIGGMTGHREAVRISYEPEVFPYEKLLDIFWRSIDPTDSEGQFGDRGEHYRTAIYYHNEEQRSLAEKSKVDVDKKNMFGKPVVTEILPATTFYPAEEKHQQYYKKNQFHYDLYYKGSGRKGFIDKHWHK